MIALEETAGLSGRSAAISNRDLLEPISRPADDHGARSHAACGYRENGVCCGKCGRAKRELHAHGHAPDQAEAIFPSPSAG